MIEASSQMTPSKTGPFIFLLLFTSLIVFGISTVATIKVLTRPKSVIVPELTHKSVESARSICRVKRLKLELADYRFDERIPANVILEQTPAAKEEVKSGRAIEVVVSRGNKSVKTPLIVDKELRQATIAIENAGLHIGRVTRLYSETIPKNQIIKQWPEPETNITYGDNVNLLISDGPKPFWFLMPDLEGGNTDQAVWILEQLGLKLREIKRIDDNTRPAGTVISQTPNPGTRVRSGIPTGLVVTKRTDNENIASRFVTINYYIPPANREVRLKMLVRDASGLHEIYNAMEKPDNELTIRRTLSGESAILKIYINGHLLEERDI